MESKGGQSLHRCAWAEMLGAKPRWEEVQCYQKQSAMKVWDQAQSM
jgi:hypothetical protein